MARPYYFIKFDKNIKKKVKDFANPSSRSNASRLNEDLSDIHSIMKKNINEAGPSSLSLKYTHTSEGGGKGVGGGSGISLSASTRRR